MVAVVLGRRVRGALIVSLIIGVVVRIVFPQSASWALKQRRVAPSGPVVGEGFGIVPVDWECGARTIKEFDGIVAWVMVNPSGTSEGRFC